VTLALLVLPAPALARFLRRTAGVWLGGLLVGSGAFLVARHLETDWPFWEPLARATLWASHALLATFVDDLRYEPEGLILGTQSFPVHVTRACTGYEGMALFAVFLGAFLLLQRERLRFPRALWILPAGMALCWLANVVRVAALIVVGDRISERLAIEAFHVYAGWPLVIAVALAAVFVATRWPALARIDEGRAGPPSTAADAGPRTVNPVAVYVAPLLVVVALGFVTGAFVEERAWSELACAIAGLATVAFYRREYALERPSSPAPLALLALIAAGSWSASIALLAPEAREGAGREAPAALLAHLLSFVVTMPLVEQLALRGYLARRLVDENFEAARLERGGVAAFFVPALVSGALQAGGPERIAATLVSLVVSFAARRRGRILDAVAVHAGANALIAAFSTLTRDASAWH
jgi:exosortase E/protease (VPEID-CTERM system)